MRKCIYAALVTLIPAGAVYAQDTLGQDEVAQAAKPARALGTVTEKSITCHAGGLTGATCQQLTVTCPSVPNVFAYLKINTPANPLGTVLYGTGTDGNGLYDTIFTFGKTAVQNVYNAGFRTVQISWGTPFNTAQPGGWGSKAPEAYLPHPVDGPLSRTTFTPRFRTTPASPCARLQIAEAPAPWPTCSLNIPTIFPWLKSPADRPQRVLTGAACARKAS